jgi:hypothetical protein
MVATSIILIITTVLLFRHQQFNSSTLLRSLSYSVALSVRQAQLYGTSVRETEAGGVFASSYAVYFLRNETTSYFLAADKNENSAIATDHSEDVAPSPYLIQNGYAIQDFCAYLSNGTAHCKLNSFIDELSIRFARPNPDAIIETDSGQSYSEACIELVSPAGATRTVRVFTTGQISVEGNGEQCNP